MAVASPAVAPLRMFVSIASIPQRVHLVPNTVRSFAAMTAPPERVFLVLPFWFTRWPTMSVNLSLVHPIHPMLQVCRCERDDGPGTKVLCVLPHLRRALLLRDGGPQRNVCLILADDDREYRHTALALVRDAWHRAALAPRAFSFQTYALPNSGGSDVADSALTVGQGADLFALPFAALVSHDLRRFFELACSIDSSFYFHDDVWLSAYLQDVAKVAVCPVTVPTLTQNASATNFALEFRKAPPQFKGPVHGPKETWATALRRLGGNSTRAALNRRLGSKRSELRERATALLVPRDETRHRPYSGSTC